MTIEIHDIVNTLSADGLQDPRLHALNSGAGTYDLLMMQPHGDLVVGVDGVRHRDGATSNEFENFLHLATSSGAALAVTPEYSMPVSVLSKAI